MGVSRGVAEIPRSNSSSRKRRAPPKFFQHAKFWQKAADSPAGPKRLPVARRLHALVASVVS